ncbi:MAG: hypothetical protein LBS32_02125 [Clostridiales Family XIII bacterium]|jgi:YbbR domain-containing protein|nr:hypothetical protein [Clostridiales Family XIII bacterium]
MLKSNTVNKIIAVALAVTLWAYVITVVNPPETRVVRGVPVRFTNLDILEGRRLTVASDVSYSIELTVKGKRADLAKLTADDFSATVDLRGWQKGETSIPVDVGGPDSVSIDAKRPSRISLNIEDLVSVSKPMRIEYSEPFESGSEPGFVSMVPDHIEVSGAKSQVDGVDYIRVLVDSGDLRRTPSTLNVAAQPMDFGGEPFYQRLGLSQSEVEVTAMLCSVRRVPLRVDLTGEVAQTLEVTGLDIPKNVYIRGSESAVNGVTSLSAAPIDISGVELTSTIALQIALPEGVELADASAGIGVGISIKGIATKEFSFSSSEISAEGTPEGFAAHINTSDITVRVFGDESVISSLSKEDITVYVDLSGMAPSEETADLPARVRSEKQLRRAETSPETVFLNIYEYEGADGEGTATGGALGGSPPGGEAGATGGAVSSGALSSGALSGGDR